MGIGLSISQSIIQAHEGRLWAAANADGPGAIFSFSIPCDVAGCDGNSLEGRMMMKRKLVSVVDDDEFVREALPDLLRSFGLEAQPFSSAAEFLASESLDRTGCLVLDVTMPGMTGPELQLELATRQLRHPHRLHHRGCRRWTRVRDYWREAPRRI